LEFTGNSFDFYDQLGQDPLVGVGGQDFDFVAFGKISILLLHFLIFTVLSIRI
jgi:hypothetical protein